MNLIRLVSVIFALSLTACASKEYVKAYQGDDVPASSLALLKPTSGIRIASIDGAFANNLVVTGARRNTDYEIALMPGAHRATVTYDIGTAYSRTAQTIEFEVKAGRKYLLKSGKNRMQWRPEVVDMTDREKCWAWNVETVFFDSRGC